MATYVVTRSGFGSSRNRAHHFGPSAGSSVVSPTGLWRRSWCRHCAVPVELAVVGDEC